MSGLNIRSNVLLKNLPDCSKLLEGLHQIRLSDPIHQSTDMHHHRRKGLVRVLIAL